MTILLRRTLIPETVPGTFFVMDAAGPFARIRMHLPAPLSIAVERDVSNGVQPTQPRDVLPMRRLDGERWKLPMFCISPGLLAVEVLLINWEW